MMHVERFEFNMLGVNTYVAFDETTREAVVIDAGCYYERERNILENYLTENRLKLIHLLNTHLHFDHIFGNGFVHARYGLKLEANPGDEDWLKGAVERTRMFGLVFPEEPVEIGVCLQEGDIVRFGNCELHCLSVPGHSRGSLAFYAPKDQVIFTGDALFFGSIGRTDLPGGNYDELIDSLHEKLLVLPEETIVYPGHGEATTIGHEKHYNYYLT